MPRSTAAASSVESPLSLVQLFPGAKLEPRGGVPLYLQVEQLVRAKIRAQVLKPGDRLPTEKELQAYFGISRVTVRQALQNLVRDGLIRRCRGRGSEVNPPKIEVSLDGLEGFTEAMEARGFKVRTKVLSLQTMPAGEDVAQALEISAGSEVCHLERIRFVNEEKIVHFQTYLQPDVGLPAAIRARGSLYEYLEERGVRPTRTEESVEAVQADATLAGRLDVPSGAPLLRRIRQSSLEDGRRIEYTLGHYRGDRYRYRFKLSR